MFPNTSLIALLFILSSNFYNEIVGQRFHNGKPVFDSKNIYLQPSSAREIDNTPEATQASEVIQCAGAETNQKFISNYPNLFDEYIIPPRKLNPITSFSLKLLQSIPTTPHDNLIISPISAQFLLSLLKKGAGGETKRQLQIVTASKSDEEINAILKQNSAGLKTALGIFYDSKIYIQDSYKQNIVNFLATVQGLDFRTSSSLVKQSINKWASDNTEGKIPNLLGEDYDLESVDLVLVSAIYFHSLWKYKFETINNMIFLNGNGESAELPFMEITQNIALYEINLNGIDCTVISLPYKDEKFSMILIIPNEFYNLDSVIKNVDACKLNEIISASNEKYPKYIKLQMPKFKLKSKQSLLQPLKKMKLVDIFSSQSNLTGITTSTNLFVSEILQQATLDVDENGTVAAAATSALLIPLSADSGPRPRLFVINKPFISIIIENESRAPLFISKINNPAL